MAPCRWLPPAVPIDEETDVMNKLGAVLIKSPATEEDNVNAMLESMDQIFEAILDRECKLSALERLLKVRAHAARRPPPSACATVSDAGAHVRTHTRGHTRQYFMPFVKDPDGVKRRRAVTVINNLLERYVDMEAQKEEKAREVGACGRVGGGGAGP